MNDYAGYLGRPAYLRATEQGLVPTPAYFSNAAVASLRLRRRGARPAGLEIEPLQHFRLIYRSRSAISRGGRWLARWKIFEIAD